MDKFRGLKSLLVLFVLGIGLEMTVAFEPVILVHGGAGSVDSWKIPYKLNGVKRSVLAGYDLLMKGKSCLDAVEQAVQVMEEDEYFNAGYGSVLTYDGSVETEAAIMNGIDLSTGCVSILKDILHPISVARRIMEKTVHNYLAGQGAMLFAKEQGFEILPPGSLITDAARKALDDFKENINKTGTTIPCEFGEPGTVGAVAIDIYGNIAAATSTGGITGKLMGRIGDTPILGAGTYADNQLGAVSATGHGETIMKFSLAHKILQAMKYRNMTAQQATEMSLKEMTGKLKGTGGAITIDRIGNLGIYFTTEQMSWAYCKSNQLHSGINAGDDFIENVLEMT